MSVDPNLEKTGAQYNIKVETKTVEYFEKKDKEERKSFESFDNLLKKDAIVARIILFISTDKK